MPELKWRSFLERFSRELLADEGIRSNLPAEVVESGWLGFPPARESEIGKLEKRLRKRLPDSYREFLQVTNGWRNAGRFVYDLRPASTVAWFRKENQDWIDSYAEWAEDNPPLPLEEHLVSGKEQDTCRFRVEFLRSTLQISGVGDSAVYLLNPGVTTPSGEWEGWFLASWRPGADRYRSFRELMEATFDNFLRDRGTAA